MFSRLAGSLLLTVRMTSDDQGDSKGAERLELLRQFGERRVGQERHERRRMKQAGRAWEGANRQGRGNDEDGTKRVWNPALVDLPCLMC